MQCQRQKIDHHNVVGQSRDVNQVKEGRHQIICLDKPSALAGGLAMQALIHEGNRLESVAEEIVLACVLAGSKVIGSADMVTVAGGARYQFGKGARKDNTVAAHCLPGRLLVNARPIDTLAEWLKEDALKDRGIKPLPISSKLRNLHGRTDVVELIVNQVDSRLERMRRGRGLKPLFGSTVQRVVAPSALEGHVNLPMIMELSHAAMDFYRLTGQFMCEELHDTLSAELREASAESKAKSITDGMVVVEQYISQLTNRSQLVDSISLLGCQRTVYEVTNLGG
jgi:hypothetical protein